MGGSVLILLLSALVVAGGTRALTSMITLSRGLAVELFQSVGAATRGADQMDLIARSGDSAWRALVYEPWLTGELSVQGRSTYRSSDGLEGGQLLAMNVTQRHNACLYNQSQGQLNCPWWGVDYLPRRMALAGWTATAGFLVSGVMITLAGSVILAQLTLLLFLALAPVWLMAALWWPEGGMQLVRGVAMKAFGALLAQGMLAAVLAVWLALMKSVHASFASAGWMFESVLMTGLAILAFRYRYAVWQPLTAILERVQRRGEPTARRQTERGRSTSQSLATPTFADVAFTIVPSTLPAQAVTIDIKAPPRPDGAEQARTSQVQVFAAQVQRMQREIELRRETHVYERVLERSKEEAQTQSEPMTPTAPFVSQPIKRPTQVQRPQPQRSMPPRPKA